MKKVIALFLGFVLIFLGVQIFGESTTLFHVFLSMLFIIFGLLFIGIAIKLSSIKRR